MNRMQMKDTSSDGKSTIAASSVNNDCVMLTILESEPRRTEQDLLTSLLFLLK